ncbi:MAG: hypothetical protein UW89_C0003G0006 [Parcubacteria group bacterium GW2011_GWB1_45_10]|nr:MAG: hypothetical protein UW89_C0003G0006 [Parcubacteria group bacterium GW2011_GWB1_45_10]
MKLQLIANELRKDVIWMCHRGKSAHLGTNLSAADIVTILYKKILRVKPKSPNWPDRDRFIVSKGHGAAIIYAALAHKGFFPKGWLKTYYKNNGKLAGHVTKLDVPGVEFSTGALGHGLPIACGVALAGKRDKKKYRVFALLSDGELDEGSNWEAILFAPQHKLDNLTAIVDYNKIQSLDFVKKTLNLEPLKAKLKAFNWEVREIDGHNHNQILKTLKSVPFKKGKPSFIIAHTIKGKGVSFMENTVKWHYANTDEVLLAQALKELSSKKK